MTTRSDEYTLPYAKSNARNASWRRGTFTFLLTFVAILVFMASFAIGYARVNEGKVLPGVDVAGVSLAGLSRGEAAAKLTESLPESFFGQPRDQPQRRPTERAVLVVRSHVRHELHARPGVQSWPRTKPDPTDPGTAPRPDQRHRCRSAGDMERAGARQPGRGDRRVGAAGSDQRHPLACRRPLCRDPAKPACRSTSKAPLTSALAAGRQHVFGR